MTDMRYPIVIVKLSDDEGGGYLAYATDLRGCMSDGVSREEAARNVQEAIREWCEEMALLGKPIPEPGSAARAAQKEREELISLCQQQDRLIKESISKLNDDVSQLQSELAKIRQRMDEIIERQKMSRQGAGAAWPYDPFMVGGQDVDPGAVARIHH
jgi:antitoxin HicB